MKKIIITLIIVVIFSACDKPILKNGTTIVNDTIIITLPKGETVVSTQWYNRAEIIVTSRSINGEVFARCYYMEPTNWSNDYSGNVVRIIESK